MADLHLRDSDSLSAREVRYLERVHLCRIITNYGPLPALEIVRLANTECDHDLFDSLPEISRRGITSKLNSMSLNGMVRGDMPGDGSPMVWRITDHGRHVCGSGFDYWLAQKRLIQARQLEGKS